VTPLQHVFRQLFKFPAELTAARRSRGVSQKVLAADVHVNPSDLSRLEHGSRILPRKDLVEAVCVALKLDEHAADNLKWAGGHDRLMAALAVEELPLSTGEAVSACLTALRALSDPEAIGLAKYLCEVARSKALLSQLTHSSPPVLHAGEPEGGPVT
jgi:transcriptional regulator with XRE-family HTH domain